MDTNGHPDGGLGICQLMADAPASEVLVLPADKATLAVCENCAKVLRDRAIDLIAAWLTEMEITPGNSGKKEAYQPLDIDDPRINELVLLRNDAKARFSVMSEAAEKHLGSLRKGEYSYVDIGCHTGYFCNRMAELGFTSTGIDASSTFIDVARVADSFVHKRSIDFVCANAVAFAKEMPTYDIVSALSTFQWLFIYEPRELVYETLRTCMAKARRLFFFDIGYRQLEMYRSLLKESIDRDWCLTQLAEGGFDEVFFVEAGKSGLTRDFFVGIREPASGS